MNGYLKLLFRLTLIPLLCVGLWGLTLLTATFVMCEELKHLPTPITYPYAQLVGQSMNVTDDYSIWKNLFDDSMKTRFSSARFGYVTSDLPKKVFDYYVDQGGHQYNIGNGDYVEGRLNRADYTLHAVWNERAEMTRFSIIVMQEACY